MDNYPKRFIYLQVKAAAFIKPIQLFEHAAMFVKMLQCANCNKRNQIIITLINPSDSLSLKNNRTAVHVMNMQKLLK